MNVELIKFISALVYPLGLFFLAVALVAFLSQIKRKAFRRLTKALLVSAVIGLLFFSTPFFASKIALVLESQYPDKPIEQINEHDLVVVLAGGLRIPTPPALRIQLGASSDRLWLATQLYKSAKARKILITGGNVYAQKGLKSEAEYSKELLIDWGVCRNDILVEIKSRTTFENREAVGKLLNDATAKEIILVTSAIHMPRAMQLFGNLAEQVTPVPADRIVRDAERPLWHDYLPSASALQLSTRALHEIYGMWFYKFKS